MNQSLKNELNYCINELTSIVRELRRVSEEVDESMSGMNTYKYVRTINSSADRYERAANKLRSIK